jgi:hypothetical protein
VPGPQSKYLGRRAKLRPVALHAEHLTKEAPAKKLTLAATSNLTTETPVRKLMLAAPWNPITETPAKELTLAAP